METNIFDFLDRDSFFGPSIRGGGFRDGIVVYPEW